jgi:hypothetical protein
MGIFDLNYSITVNETFMGSNIYYIDNFYKNPDAVLDLFNKTPSRVHHPTLEAKSLNGVHFDDRRHILEDCNEISKVYKYLSNICGEKPLYDDRIVLTNRTRFFKHDFNNFKDNYWYPHIDFGYNGIVYLNKGDDTCGTNLYRNIYYDKPIAEHVEPWRPKERYDIIKTIKPKFNRCVLFDGKKFPHGMNIPNDMYFGEEYRFNQVFFFKS